LRRHALLGVTALLVADQHDRPAVEAREAADDGVVVGVHAVAMQFLELVADRAGVFERVGALRMAASCATCQGVRLRRCWW